MQYEKEIILKDGAKCFLRGAGEADAAAQTSASLLKKPTGAAASGKP